MANSSSKRIAAANRTFLATLLRVMAGVNTVTMAVLFLWFRYPTFGWVWLPYYASMGSSLVLYRTLYGLGNPYTNSAGEVTVNADLGSQGLHQYMFDTFCVVLAAQVLSLFTGVAWYLLLVIPGYALYRLVGFVRPFLPSIFGSRSRAAPSMEQFAAAAAPAAPAAKSAAKQQRQRPRVVRG
ncbi:hypothetical protein H9P43_003655 [Blastocladiella emersonii ATCC 22665]|nr:hypothetical protein H9P43_003655 [Blastocladiella emersonii ATCC 22665]